MRRVPPLGAPPAAGAGAVGFGAADAAVGAAAAGLGASVGLAAGAEVGAGGWIGAQAASASPAVPPLMRTRSCLRVTRFTMIRPLRCLGAVSGRHRVVEYGRAAVDLRHRRDRAREDRQDALLGTLEVMVQ